MKKNERINNDGRKNAKLDSGEDDYKETGYVHPKGRPSWKSESGVQETISVFFDALLAEKIVSADKKLFTFCFNLAFAGNFRIIIFSHCPSPSAGK